MKDINSNFTKLAIKDLELREKVEKWDSRKLGDFLIQRVWGESFNEIGTLESVVLDRVINILFDLDDKQKGIKREIFPPTPAEYINKLIKEGK